MILNNPTRSEREMYDIAPDYLDGEEDEEAADREERERREDDFCDDELERRRE